jgi:hypothetical protein
MKSKLLFNCSLLIAFLRSGSCSSDPLKSEEILSAILAQYDIDLSKIENCSLAPRGQGNAPHHISIAEDFSYYLSRMNTGSNSITAECEMDRDSSTFCTVTLNHELDELVWNRIYRFRIKLDGTKSLSDLECFTIP